jgi:16S rRNA (guanine1516-N2)-methyltransferase
VLPVRLFTANPSLAAAPHYLEYCEIHEAAEPPRLTAGAALWLDEEGLMLSNAQLAQPLRLTSALLERRLRGKSMLLRACGTGSSGSSVLDAFAGFGFDALTLCKQGFAVTAVERDPLVWLMLMEFAERLGIDLPGCCGDSVSIMASAARRWDIVYLDPMFPPRHKRALPNLALQHLQHLCSESPIAAPVGIEACLELAQACALRRVVLKRRLKDPTLGKPSHQLKGQAVRFDVYI